jgi:DNA repair photolyase
MPIGGGPAGTHGRGDNVAPIVKEVRAKSILSRSQVYPYVINPYTGCQHACSYCYARFMKRFSGHQEPWGAFVDVKANAADLLRSEITKKAKSRVWVSGVCDPYQPLEARYRLTRQCLEILVQHGWPVVVQTRSPMVIRDIDILKAATDVEVGLSVTTADDRIRRVFEPHAPSIDERLSALAELHQAGIRTYAMIAPMLPGAEGLGALLSGKIDYLLIDRMNYHHADWIYRKHGLQDGLSDGFFRRTARALAATCEEAGIECRATL